MGCLERVSYLTTVAFVVLMLAFMLQLIGLATPYWQYKLLANEKSYSGLWQKCHSDEEKTYCLILNCVQPSAAQGGNQTVTPSTTAEGKAAAFEQFNCPFDYGPCGWTQDKTDTFDWTMQSGGTPSQDTGPTGDHTSGNGAFYYIESSSPRIQNDTARLISPLQVVGTNSPSYCLTFWYNMFGSNINALNVYMKNDSNLSSPIWNKMDAQGQPWKNAQITLQPKASYNIVFEGIIGIGYHGDIAIDDVLLQEGHCLNLVSPLTYPTDESINFTIPEVTTTGTISTLSPLSKSTTSSYMYNEQCKLCNYIKVVKVVVILASFLLMIALITIILQMTTEKKVYKYIGAFCCIVGGNNDIYRTCVDIWYFNEKTTKGISTLVGVIIYATMDQCDNLNFSFYFCVIAAALAICSGTLITIDNNRSLKRIFPK